MLERFTQKAVQSISLAQAESRRFGYPSVDYEQLMLGLMGTETSAATQFLQASGVNLDSARNLVVKLIAQRSGHVPLEIPLTTNTQQALQQSLTKARQQGANFSVGTHHLLWGLLQQSDRQAALVLETLGLDLQHLTHKLDRVISKSYLTLVDDEQECTSERTDFSCDAIAIRLASSMLAWVEPRRLGVIATKSVRFRNSDGRVECCLPFYVAGVTSSSFTKICQKPTFLSDISQILDNFVELYKQWSEKLSPAVSKADKTPANVLNDTI